MVGVKVWLVPAGAFRKIMLQFNTFQGYQMKGFVLVMWTNHLLSRHLPCHISIDGFAHVVNLNCGCA
jgi:hypothetical protein